MLKTRDAVRMEEQFRIAQAGESAPISSRQATLLVVGSRGLGGFMGLVMGSVSSQCVHHSHCPVLVVREEH